MKIRQYSFLALLGSSILTSCLTGCEEAPALYTTDNALYFGVTDTAIAYTFAKYPKKKIDTILVPVNVLGSPTTNDRSIQSEVIPATGENGAIEGVHFKVLDIGKVPANAVSGSIPIVLYRTEDLEAGKVVNFTLGLKNTAEFPVDGISNKQKININIAYIQKPASWGEFTGTVTGFFAGYKDNFGTWSPTKYKLILDALYDENTGITVTEFPGSRFGPPVIYNQYVARVRNYIKIKYPGNYGLPGAILVDPDNSNQPIQVGPANY